MKAIVVDDDFGSRAGVLATLAELYPGSELHAARSVAEATAILERERTVDLVLLDLNLERSRGIDTLREMKRWCEEQDCNPRIVVLSAAADYDASLIPAAIDHCATGFITKGTSVEVFKSAIDLTLAGSIFIPERYLASRRTPARALVAGEVVFTGREKQVAALLVQGLTYKQIARRLSQGGHAIADNTVRVHVQRIAWKLRVSDEAAGDGLAAKAAVITAFAEGRWHFDKAA